LHKKNAHRPFVDVDTVYKVVMLFSAAHGNSSVVPAQNFKFPGNHAKNSPSSFKDVCIQNPEKVQALNWIIRHVGKNVLWIFLD
jgi:hypothetical protein